MWAVKAGSTPGAQSFKSTLGEMITNILTEFCAELENENCFLRAWPAGPAAPVLRRGEEAGGRLFLSTRGLIRGFEAVHVRKPYIAI